MRLLTLLLLAFLANCTTTKSTTVSDNVIKNEILIDLAADISPAALTSEFKKYRLTEQKKISPSLNIYLFTFDETTITVNALIEKVKLVDGVENAQSNKKTSNR